MNMPRHRAVSMTASYFIASVSMDDDLLARLAPTGGQQESTASNPSSPYSRKCSRRVPFGNVIAAVGTPLGA